MEAALNVLNSNPFQTPVRGEMGAQQTSGARGQGWGWGAPVSALGM